MKQVSNKSALLPSRKTLVGMAVASALFAAAAAPSHAAGLVTIKGVVSGSYFTPPTATVVGSSAASYYAGAKVCFDLNGNGVCDTGEPSATTTAAGTFSLASATSSGLVVEIPTTATNAGHPVTQRTVFRAPVDLIVENTKAPLVPVSLAVTPLSTEVVRMMESEGSAYGAAKNTIAERLGVDATEVLADLNKLSDASDRQVLANESTVLANRFGFATRMFDRHDAAAGTMKAAEQAAMNVEGIPRYDNIIVVIMENKATLSIKGSLYAPKINAILNANNQFNTYFATGNPSEPNYTAIGGADDWGITDDNQWNCGATGANAVQDLPEPTTSVAGLAHSPFTSPCAQATNHNIVGRPNLFNAITANGMTWRTYSESMNPGQDFRTDSVADAAVTALDHVYAPGTAGPNTTTQGTPNLVMPLPAGLYKTKHHPGMAYQNVRSAPEFKSSNRTLGGGQWDPNLLNTSVYSIPAGYNIDQFSADLQSGDLGTLNFVVPDQCDDMHGISVTGKVNGAGSSIAASDCTSVSNGVPKATGGNILTRGDNYVDQLVTKIKASPVWNNPAKRVAVVLMFDEGNATGTNDSCCGWNTHVSNVNSLPLIETSPGVFTQDASVAGYNAGNRGHGNSIFAVLNNQPQAPKGLADSDAYSHFSFVRTLQDMFQLADPAVDGSYMNRSKYTESFIAANILALPEYAGSADTHFDSVRPMNHQYVIPNGYVHPESADMDQALVGPDTNQVNMWALK